MGTVRYTVIDGEVIAEKRNGVRRQYVPDPLGSTIALLDNTQAQTDTFDYWPYGEESNRTGTTAIPLRFVGTLGYYRDSSSKTYVRARTLDTQKGRWLTEDQFLFVKRSLYTYSDCAPITWVDTSGYFTEKCCDKHGKKLSCKQACRILLSEPDSGVGEVTGATVICCHSKPCICMIGFSGVLDPYKEGLCPAIDFCIRVHENEHIIKEDISCYAVEFGPPIWQGVQSAIENERRADSITCLNQNKGRSTPMCRKWIDILIKHLQGGM